MKFKLLYFSYIKLIKKNMLFNINIEIFYLWLKLKYILVIDIFVLNIICQPNINELDVM